GVSYNKSDVIARDFYYVKFNNTSNPILASDQATHQPISTSHSPETETLSRLASKFRRSNRAILNNIYFDLGAFEIKTQSEDVLESLKDMLGEEQRIFVEIAGHTDNTEQETRNEELSFDRAFAVKTWLVENGIDPGRLVAKGYGSSRPLASNDDELDGRELNRRIEIIVHE
ncbi:MAG: OmpA family protein, partial [Bacteroidota bacterium]